MSTLHAIITVFGAAIIEAAGLTILRTKIYYSIPIASSIFAFLVVPLLAVALKYEGIGMVNFFWNIFSTVMMFLIGVYYFGEKLHSLQIIGIIFSLLGLFLILIDPDK